MIQAFYQLRHIHKEFARAASALEAGIGRPGCIPSCGICCQQNTPFWMTIEGIHAISVLTGNHAVGKMVSIAEGWLLEHHKPATLYEGMPIGMASTKLREEWQAVMRSQCPFLDAQMLCLIHEVRPLTCRAYGVTRDTVNQEGVDFCPRPVGQGETVNQKLVVEGSPIRAMTNTFRAECVAKNKAWIVSGFVPTVLFRVAQPDKFKKYVLDNQIASAKLVGVEYETTLMWQPQIVALREGRSPELALLAR